MKNSCEIQIYNNQTHAGKQLFIEAQTEAYAGCQIIEIVINDERYEVNADELRAAIFRTSGEITEG